MGQHTRKKLTKRQLKIALEWFDDHNFSDFDFRDYIKDMTLEEIKEDMESYYPDLEKRLKKVKK